MISFLRFCIIFFLLLACQKPITETAEEIIEKSILSYGFGYGKYKINFDFRAYHYQLEQNKDNCTKQHYSIVLNKYKILDWIFVICIVFLIDLLGIFGRC